MPSKTEVKKEQIVIEAPNFQVAHFSIQGVSPYVQNAFSRRSMDTIVGAQTAVGSAAKKGKKKLEPRDIDREYHDAIHFMEDEKTYGIPAPAFRAAMISACRVCGFAMTRAKLTIFIEPDGFDYIDGSPLVQLFGDPEKHIGRVRLESGVTSVAVRPMWRKWGATIRVRWDADQFGLADILNLLMRAGQQVGIGEGRPDSRKSNGMGWGLFVVTGAEEQEN